MPFKMYYRKPYKSKPELLAELRAKNTLKVVEIAYMVIVRSGPR